MAIKKIGLVGTTTTPVAGLNLVVSGYYREVEEDHKTPGIYIAVSGLGTFDNLKDYDRSATYRFACALKDGVAGPADAEDLYLNYSAAGRVGVCTIESPDGKSIEKNTVADRTYIVFQQWVPGEPTSTNIPISGNGIYDIYSATITSRDGKILGYGTLESYADYRCEVPIPHRETDFDVNIIDVGTTVNNNPICEFIIDFEEELQSFTDIWDVGTRLPDPSIAASGYAAIWCSGIGTELWFSPSYAAELPRSTSPYYQYVYTIGGTGSFSVPIYKLSDDIENEEFQGYDFYVAYINSNGIMSPPVTLRYTSDVLRKFHTTKYQKPDVIPEIKDEQFSGPHLININCDDTRKRLAIGIQDIDLESIKYKSKGKYISRLFYSETPIYAVKMNTTEQFPFITNEIVEPWDFVQYFIQFGNDPNSDWLRISPTPRVSEIDKDGNSVPTTILLDTLMNEDDSNALFQGEFIKLVSTGKPIHNFRVKIEMDTSKSSTSTAWSPLIYDYNVSIVDRNFLKYGEIERFLF